MLSILMMLAAAQGGAEPGTPADNPGAWVTNADYPAAAMREEREGVVRFRLIYDEQGLPTSCEITTSSGHADLDATTCRLVQQRARFKPGRDAAGKAAGGSYRNSIRWQIPKGGAGSRDWPLLLSTSADQNWPRSASPGPAFRAMKIADHYPASALEAGEQGIVGLEIRVDAAGKPTTCTVTKSSGFKALDDATCPLVTSKGDFTPALDQEGKPTMGRYAGSFLWNLPSGASAGILGAVGRPKVPTVPAGRTEFAFSVNSDGVASDCTFTKSDSLANSSAERDDWTGCKAMGKLNFQPYLDDSGKPVAKRVTVIVDTRVEDLPVTPK